VANFDSRRLGALFRQRAQIAGELHQARAIAERLTLEHNDLVRDAGQAATAGGRQRAQAKASRKGEEAAKARDHADGLSRNLHDKETEIADLIEALWAASQPLLSAGTIRQLNDHLGAISHGPTSIKKSERSRKRSTRQRSATASPCGRGSPPRRSTSFPVSTDTSRTWSSSVGTGQRTESS
jgi:hypothetical protein